MRKKIEISEQCCQCRETIAFTITTFFNRDLSEFDKDAERYFELQGWIKLPSGRWICNSRQHSGQQQKEVA